MIYPKQRDIVELSGGRSCLSAYPLRLDTVPPLCATNIAGQLQPHGLQTFMGCWAFGESQKLCGVAGLIFERPAFPKAVFRAAANKRVWHSLDTPGSEGTPQEAREHQGCCLVSPCHGTKPKPSWSSSRLQGCGATTQAGFSIYCFKASVPAPQADLGTLQ